MASQPNNPIRHAVILAHPDADSFNASVAETYCNAVRECWQEPVLRDLYALHFDPVLRQNERPGRGPFKPAADVNAELAAIDGASVFVLIYPIWFGTPPAMMKGYVDRVLGSGVTAHDVQERSWHAQLGGKRLLSFTTTGTRTPWLAEQGQSLSLKMVFDDYLARAFSMRRPDHVHFGSIAPGMSSQQADEHLAMVREHARRLCSEVAFEKRQAEIA
jgi:NAD(P)H dehydrogenase (quinone)